MISIDRIPSTGPDVLLQDIRHDLLERVWLGLFIIALIGAPVSVSRAVFTGWVHLYTFHIVMALAVITVYLLRAKLSSNIKSAFLLAVFTIIGVTGLITFGLLGAGVWWLVMSSLLASMLYSMRIGIAFAASSLAVFVVSGYAFTSGYLTLPVDANTYAISVSSWILFLVIAFLMPLILFQSIALFHSTTIKLLGEVHRQREEIESFAHHDQLTGLPLLNLAQDRLEMALHEARRSNTQAAVLFVDLDGFKGVNDTYGHEVGDHVLKETSKRLSRSLRAIDTAARIGGDEFILVLVKLTSKQEAALAARRVIQEVSKPVTVQEHRVLVGASIGIALFPDNGRDAASLRRAADLAMYSVKNRGKNNFSFASPEAA